MIRSLKQSLGGFPSSSHTSQNFTRATRLWFPPSDPELIASLCSAASDPYPRAPRPRSCLPPWVCGKSIMGIHTLENPVVLSNCIRVFEAAKELSFSPTITFCDKIGVIPGTDHLAPNKFYLFLKYRFVQMTFVRNGIPLYSPGRHLSQTPPCPLLTTKAHSGFHRQLKCVLNHPSWSLLLSWVCR